MFETRIFPLGILITVAYVAYSIYKSTPYTEFLAFCVYLGTSFLSYLVTNSMIPKIQLLNLKADMFGMDINKKGTKEGEIKIPESLGLVPATIYLVFNILGILFTKAYMPEFVLAHTTALLSVSFVVLLGFADDVLDLAWRYKMVLPPIASLPVIVAYTGGTTIVLPHLVHGLLGTTLDLGPIYYIYMCLLATFQTNAINIYAGINGLEVGQSIVIACSIAIHNCIEIQAASSVSQQHLFSLLIILPFIFTSLALYKHNHYPSKVFVGDVFCYWAGMTFAVSSILGHFSKTLMLFCIPQVLNFLYSTPQLFGIIHCPRHRLPRYNQKTQLLEPIKSNLTLINLFLLIKGPTGEKQLCQYLLIFQVICCALGFVVRYLGSQIFF